MSEVEPPLAPLQGACSSTRLKWPAADLFYWNSHIDHSKGLFQGISSNHDRGSKVWGPKVQGLMALEPDLVKVDHPYLS